MALTGPVVNLYDRANDLAMIGITNALVRGMSHYYRKRIGSGLFVAHKKDNGDELFSSSQIRLSSPHSFTVIQGGSEDAELNLEGRYILVNGTLDEGKKVCDILELEHRLRATCEGLSRKGQIKNYTPIMNRDHLGGVYVRFDDPEANNMDALLAALQQDYDSVTEDGTNDEVLNYGLVTENEINDEVLKRIPLGSISIEKGAAWLFIVDAAKRQEGL